MSQLPNINEVNHPHIEKSINYVVAIGSLVGIVAGVVAILSSNLKADSSTGLLSLGVILIIVGLYFLLAKSKQIIYKETRSKILKQSYFFERGDFDKMVEMLNAGSFDHKAIKFLDNGSTRLDIIQSKDGQFVAAQLLEFVPFQHEPATEIFYFTNEKAKNFIAYMEKCTK